MRRWFLVCVIAGCGSSGDVVVAPSEPLAATAGPPPPVTTLRETDRWARLAVPVAFAADGEQWIGARDRELVLYDGDREVQRLPVMVGGSDGALAPLPGGGWIAGARVLAADGSRRFDGWGWALKYGRFGSPKASAISPDGRVAIVYGADSPSTCLCDRDRGTAGSSAGALVRLSFDRERPDERVLAEHEHGIVYALAASPTAIAAMAGGDLLVWPATGDAAPTTAHLDGTTLENLAWATDRYLVGTRYVDPDRTDVVVLDRDAGWQPAWSWPIAGTPRDLKVRPGGAELAVAWANYRATDRVLRDDRKVGVFALDGTRRAELDTAGHPMSIAWSPRGDALLVSTVGTEEDEARVIRYAVR
jgi:hypothetical protein